MDLFKLALIGVLVIGLAGILSKVLALFVYLRRSQALNPTEREEHAAEAFARLLVSDIRVYNERAVAEGRTRGDLYARMRQDIDRARALYDRRASDLAEDYFHEQLVAVLCGGNAQLLGPGYPGPRAGADPGAAIAAMNAEILGEPAPDQRGLNEREVPRRPALTWPVIGVVSLGLFALMVRFDVSLRTALGLFFAGGCLVFLPPVCGSIVRSLRQAQPVADKPAMLGDRRPNAQTIGIVVASLGQAVGLSGWFLIMWRMMFHR